ncbi:hypothetical protein ES703_95786 [subsurface metagenome]
MESRKGFTLIELMVVILIVGILAAVAIPIMRGRVDAAKWTEGKAMMGTLATAIRAYAAEKGPHATLYGDEDVLTLVKLGFATGDLTGTYFSSTNYSWVSDYDPTDVPPVLTYTITATAPTGISTPTEVTLTQAGAWTP